MGRQLESEAIYLIYWRKSKVSGVFVSVWKLWWIDNLIKISGDGLI